MYLAFFLNCTCGTQLSYTVFWKQIVLKAHQLGTIKKNSFCNTILFKNCPEYIPITFGKYSDKHIFSPWVYIKFAH